MTVTAEISLHRVRTRVQHRLDKTRTRVLHPIKDFSRQPDTDMGLPIAMESIPENDISTEELEKKDSQLSKESQTAAE